MAGRRTNGEGTFRRRVDGRWESAIMDGFDVDGKPDEKVWSYEHGFARNNEAQWYQEDNALCQDGYLTVSLPGLMMRLSF